MALIKDSTQKVINIFRPKLRPNSEKQQIINRLNELDLKIECEECRLNHCSKYESNLQDAIAYQLVGLRIEREYWLDHYRFLYGSKYQVVAVKDKELGE